MRTLEVYLEDELVGRIVESRKGGRFAYEPSIVKANAGSPVLSLAFPAKARPFGEAKTANWFNGLLPEGDRRTEISRSLGVSPYDWMGLLSKIGWECAGAVKVFEEGEAESHAAQYREINEEELIDKLSHTSSRLPQASTTTFRISLGGFQEKICVAMPRIPEGAVYIGVEGVLLPEGDAPSTHILKPENERDYPGSAESEAWAMRVAGKAARCSRVALLELEGAPPTLAVERYDRASADWPKDIKRIHQEDACQALGLDPSDKYADEKEIKKDDPRYKAIAKLLVMHAEKPSEELKELLRQMTVNLALGNWDAHAKNTSFLYEKPMVPTVAPLYDVVPISEVEARTKCLSMRVNGLIRPEDVTRHDVIDEATGWGLPENVVEDVLDLCLDNLAEGIRAAAPIYPTAASRHEESALKRIANLSCKNPN